MSGIRLKRLQHLVLWVSNVERSVRFYCDVLGFEVKRQYPNAAFLIIPGTDDDHHLGLFEQPGLRAPDERVARMYHSAWEVAELSDLAQARRRLIEAGSLVGQSDHGTSLSLYAKDPDGLEFEIFWTVPEGTPAGTRALNLDAELAKRGVTKVLFALLLVLLAHAPAAAVPEGQMTWATHFSLAPTFFDPAETPGIITPFLVLYALHDALVKPMPGRAQAESLAQSWSVSADGTVYEFVLRQGVKFHNGDPVTADDMTFFGTPATGAAWIVPKKYVEKVGDDGVKKAPVGAGPYKFVSFTPGVELVLDANEHYWRKAPSVKRLVFKSVPDEATRLAMLKRGEADIGYSIRGAGKTPGRLVERLREDV